MSQAEYWEALINGLKQNREENFYSWIILLSIPAVIILLSIFRS